MDISKLSSIESEKFLLGDLMTKSGQQQIVTVSARLSPDDFYRYAYGRIYSVMVDMALHHEPIDLVTLSERLKKDGLLDKVGGYTEIANIASTGVSAGFIDSRIKTIVGDSKRRQMVDLCQQALSVVSDKTKEIDLNKLEADIAAIGMDKGRPARWLCDDVTEWELEQKTPEQGIPTGIPSLDKVLPDGGWGKSDFSILAARPAIGKSALAANCAIRAAAKGYKVLFLSLEMPKGKIIRRLVSGISSIPGQRLRDVSRLGQEERLQYARALSYLKRLPVIIQDRQTVTDKYTDIVNAIRLAVKRDGIQLVFVDYLQLIQTSEYKDRFNQIGYVSRGLRQLSLSLPVSIVALAQLNRDTEKRPDIIPKLIDLKGSGDMEQDACNVLLLYRRRPGDDTPIPAGKPACGLIVAKDRDGGDGMIIPLRFEPDITVFREIAKGVQEDDE